MSTSLVNFRLDDEVKKEMESVCAEIGISMSAAFNIYARAGARNGRIPFDVSSTALTQPSPLIVDTSSDASIEAAIAPALADIRDGHTYFPHEARDYLRKRGVAIDEDEDEEA